MSNYSCIIKTMVAGFSLFGIFSSSAALAAPLTSFSKRLCDSNAPAALCDSTQPALPTSFTVVHKIGRKKVNQLVIDFVSGACVGSGRSDVIFISATPDGGAKSNPDSGDNFSDNFFYFTPNQYIPPAGTNGVQVFSQSSKIYLNPGDTVTLSHDLAEAGVQRCTAELNGHYDLR